MAWAFTETDISRNDGRKELFLKMIAYLLSNLMGEPVPFIIHRQDDALDKQIWIK